MVSVELRNVAKSFNRRPIFRDVSIRVEDGHALAITGANGSGKSTLLRLMCGLLQPTSGDVVIFIDGKTFPPTDVRQAFGLVAPDLALYGELTALENMAFFARVRNIPRDQGYFGALLDRMGLSGRGDDDVRTYSSGMRHRLKYACALLHQPAILLLDEPSANLDEDGIAIVRTVIDAQKKHGILVLATNDPGEASLGDQTLRLGQVGQG